MCADIARLFHKYGRRKPGGANRSHEILRNMFDCAQREDESPVCVAAVRLLLLTGCRPGEICCLRWSEVKSDRFTC